MNTLIFKVDGENIKWVSGYEPTSGEKNYSKLRFEFNEDWKGVDSVGILQFFDISKPVVLAGIEVKNMIAVADISSELRNQSGILHIGVMGVKSDTPDVTLSSHIAYVPVGKGVSLVGTEHTSFVQNLLEYIAKLEGRLIDKDNPVTSELLGLGVVENKHLAKDFKVDTGLIENDAVDTSKLADGAVTGRKIAPEEIEDEHLINKYWKTNRTSIILREGFLHDFIIQNSSELGKPFEHIYIILNKGFDGLDCIGVGRCFGMFADTDKFVLHNMITGKSCVVTFTAEEIVSVEEIISNKVDQEYNSESTNAQSGIAVEQAVNKGKDFVYLGELPDISRLDKQLWLKEYDTTKTYRFDFGNDMHIDDNVIPSGSYVGNIMTTDEQGLILHFASLVFDGVKRTIVLDTGIPNVYDYFEETVFAVESDFTNAGSFSTVAELKEYPFEENKLYSLFIPSDSELSASLNSGNYSYWTATYLVDKADVPDGTIRFLLLTNKYDGRECRVDLHSGEITTLNEFSEADQTFDPETTPQSTNAISGKVAAEMLESVAEQWGEELDNKAPVKIEDIGNYFVSETVEGALQELGAEVAGVAELLAQI